jgi:hypothetical protein
MPGQKLWVKVGQNRFGKGCARATVPKEGEQVQVKVDAKFLPRNAARDQQASEKGEEFGGGERPAGAKTTDEKVQERQEPEQS